MLVLSRKKEDAIVIGDDVRITIVKIDRNHVRLGIEAPGHTSIIREELLIADEDHRQAREAWVASDRTSSQE